MHHYIQAPQPLTKMQTGACETDCMFFSAVQLIGCGFARFDPHITKAPFPFPCQEAIIQIMKMRKKITNAQLQTELVEILKNMFLPQKKMIKEQIEWLIEHKYIRRDESDINTFIYMAQRGSSLEDAKTNVR